MKTFSPSAGLNSQRSREAFTLVEMLVVIGIIVLLAGLVVGLAPSAVTKMRRARVEGEREALITYIESYHKAKGFYPPDNPNDPTNVQTPLFYELTGMILTNNPPNTFVSIAQEKIPSSTIALDFGGRTGFLNASADPNEVQNFCGKALKNNQYAPVKANTPGIGTYMVLGVVVPGPIPGGGLPSTTQPYINPWHYVSSNPTNNQSTYDLWIDVLWGGKTNRVSNWSKDPQPL